MNWFKDGPWVAGYACQDPDCCYDEARYATEKEARESIALFEDDPFFETWVEWRPAKEEA